MKKWILENVLEDIETEKVTHAQGVECPEITDRLWELVKASIINSRSEYKVRKLNMIALLHERYPKKYPTAQHVGMILECAKDKPSEFVHRAMYRAALKRPERCVNFANCGEAIGLANKYIALLADASLSSWPRLLKTYQFHRSRQNDSGR